MTEFLRPGATDNDVLALVKKFIGLLASGNFNAAMDITYVSEDSEWTPERLKRIIENYGSEGDVPEAEKMHVTDLTAAEINNGGAWFIKSVFRAREESLEDATVEYGLPLNGRQSDLNLHFEIYKSRDGFALSLYDVCVD
ncbi:MAG TPA: hypothetical protein V6C86_17805 [Oculatellaceae cyanobacterium]